MMKRQLFTDREKIEIVMMKRCEEKDNVSTLGNSHA
jgi:hypothetical protein